MDYHAAKELAETRKRKIDHNTYLETDSAPDSYGIRLHATRILQFNSDGSVILDSGGWQTVTTKDRLNKFLPSGYRVWQEARVWYLSHMPNGWDNSNPIPFADRMVINPDGTVSGQGEDPKAKLRLKRRIDRYAKAYIEALDLGNVPAPSAGDCWFCSLFQGQTADASHLTSHMEEKYFVPSLLVNALKAFPQSRAAEWYLAAKWQGGDDPGQSFGGIAQDQLRKALRRYMYRQSDIAS